MTIYIMTPIENNRYLNMSDYLFNNIIKNIFKGEYPIINSFLKKIFSLPQKNISNKIQYGGIL